MFFTTTGWGGASIEELTYRHQYDFFQSQLQMTLNRFGKIDGILFHQGKSNHSSNHKSEYGKGSSESYKKDSLILVQKVRGVTDAPIYLSQASLCKSSSDKILLDIQDEIIREEQGVLRGPNSDLLDDRRYRLPDYCHFSSAGLDELSKMWVESIIKSSEN